MKNLGKAFIIIDTTCKPLLDMFENGARRKFVNQKIFSQSIAKCKKKISKFDIFYSTVNIFGRFSTKIYCKSKIGWRN